MAGQAPLGGAAVASSGGDLLLAGAGLLVAALITIERRIRRT
jgi:hypothetical protein